MAPGYPQAPTRPGVLQKSHSFSRMTVMFPHSPLPIAEGAMIPRLFHLPWLMAFAVNGPASRTIFRGCPGGTRRPATVTISRTFLRPAPATLVAIG
jgi:hypothetical protein